MIPAREQIKFDISGSADGADDQDATIAIRAELSKYFTVQRVYLDAQSVFEFYGWPFVGDVVVTTNEAHAEIADVASIVAHAIYVATGYMPSVSAPAFGGPSQNAPSLFPSLPSAAGIGQSIGDAVNAATKSIGEGLKNLLQPTAEGAIETIMPLVVIVAVIAIVLVVNVGGKTTRVGVA